MNAHLAISWSDAARRAAFERWLHGLSAAHALDTASLRSASADASFRRYFRIHSAQAAGGTRIVMDAPPPEQDGRPFVRVAELLRQGGLNAPQVLAWDEAQGFMLLEDLGDVTLLDAVTGLDSAQATPLYRTVLDALLTLQRIPAETLVPAYDETLLQRELGLFSQWYVERHCSVVLDGDQRERLARCERLILDNCLAQPRVLVHRDYHSRNLMLSRPAADAGAAVGVLDFQDAVWGPASYDLVSLLRDAYVAWDEEVQLDWAVRYWERARKVGIPLDADFGSFWRDFEWMGLQRHLKVLGIFARLSHRDGKDGYLKDIPRVWGYAHRVAARYQGLGPLALLLERLAGTQRESGYTF